ncbi:hypothetical protein TNCV_1007971 [Trichonephila clavipes]|nr:hypothetical protein TNCV_1007971 [Trichonephila clavipes]
MDFEPGSGLICSTISMPTDRTKTHGAAWELLLRLPFTLQYRVVRRHSIMINVSVSAEREERPWPSGIRYHHTGPATGVMLWTAIGYMAQALLDCVVGCLNSQQYILRPWKRHLSKE